MNISAARRLDYVSVNTPEFYGLTDTSAVELPEAPKDTRHLRAIDALLTPNVSAEARKRCQQIMSVYPAGVLEGLKKHGLSMEITKGQAVQGMTSSGAAAVGGYDPNERKIIFDEAILMSSIGRHVVTHELVHAMDHMRGERTNPGKMLASTNDAELLPIYARYLARGAVEAVGQIRATIKAEHGTLPPTAQVTVEDNWGQMTVEYKQQGDQEIIRIEQQPRTETSMVAERMREEATGSKGARALPPTEVEVDLQRGGKAHVLQEGSVSTITLPRNSVTFLGDIWSDYAHRSAMPEEYTAEAFSHYLEGGSKKDEMEFVDPDMLAYTQKVLTEEFNLHP